MKSNNPFITFLTYPLTWLVIVLIGVAHLIFASWFQPPLFYNLLAGAVDVILICGWFVLALKSKSFQKQFNKMPYEKQSKEIVRILAGCPENFKTPALQCITLMDSINKEFHNEDYQVELALLVSNIYNLAQEHKSLYTRFQTFGTPEQKQQMKTLIDQQVNSIVKIHTTLQDFSGNLTILAANVDKATEATNELKYINEGLKEVITGSI